MVVEKQLKFNNRSQLIEKEYRDTSVDYAVLIFTVAHRVLSYHDVIVMLPKVVLDVFFDRFVSVADRLSLLKRCFVNVRVLDFTQMTSLIPVIFPKAIFSVLTLVKNKSH